MSKHPPYLAEALRDLTRTERKFVLAGCIHGDFQMRTVNSLLRKHLFYIKPDSPNGRYGFARLTGLGERVQDVLKEREAARQARAMEKAA